MITEYKGRELHNNGILILLRISHQILYYIEVLRHLEIVGKYFIYALSEDDESTSFHETNL